MSYERPFTKENLDACLKELGKEFRKLSGTKIPAEIVLIGGAAILANYGFRDMTYDVDAIILATSAMSEAANRVGDRMGLPNGWLNMDFKDTGSYTAKLLGVSVYYKTFSNVVTVRTVSAEYLIAMKLMSGRQYKNDLSDIVGILWEHRKNGEPISREVIDKAIATLYGENAEIPDVSQKTLDGAFSSGDFERAYREIRETEKKSRDILLDFVKLHPGELKGENINTVLEQAERKKPKGKDGGDRR
jgi:predicted nucleotidyltransferase